ncbi:MAG: hypothetical protein KA807_03435 [Prolixibacteraceae bacterium]|nr:hypothetical protein [Prolixibacteraceae bacterium]
MKRIITLIVFLLLIGGAILFYVRHFYVFGEGVKAGNLNFIVNKGYVFKTWEGRVIQTGFKTPVPGSMQSNEFEFSITNDSIAKVLELSSGKFVELRYKEYLAPLPWRGQSKYIVTEIIKIEQDNSATGLPY